MPFTSVLKSVLSDACPSFVEGLGAQECFWYIKYPATKAAAEHVAEVTELVLRDQGLLAPRLHADKACDG